MIVNEEELEDIIVRDVRDSLEDETKIRKLVEEKYTSREKINKLNKDLKKESTFGFTFMNLFFLILFIFFISLLPPIT